MRAPQAVANTNGYQVQWAMDRPKPLQGLFKPHPPPETFFSRTFKKPANPALQPSASQQQDSAKDLAQDHKAPSKERSQSESAWFTFSSPATQQTNDGRSASGYSTAALQQSLPSEEAKPTLAGDSERGRLGSSPPYVGLSARAPSHGAESAHLGSSIRPAKGVLGEGVDIQRSRHERVASLNAWGQETAPNVAPADSVSRLASLESGAASQSGQQTSPPGQQGTRKPEAAAESAFDFRRPPIPAASSAQQSGYLAFLPLSYCFQGNSGLSCTSGHKQKGGLCKAGDIFSKVLGQGSSHQSS